MLATAAPPPAGASVGNFAMVVQPDGKILVAGGAGRLIREGRRREFGAVARFLPDGRPDPSFGDGGITIARPLAPFTAIALRPDGRIDLASSLSQVTQLLADGRFDRRFGIAGRAAPGTSSSWYPTSIAVGDDGAILTGGMDGYPKAAGSGLYGRLHAVAADGRSGPAWIGAMTSGDGGPGEPNSVLNDFLILPSGAIVGAGNVVAKEAGARSHAALVGLVPAPTDAGGYPTGPTPAFGGGVGLVESSFFPADARPEAANAIARDPQGRLLVAGEAAGQMLLARYSEDGILDQSFGVAGAALTRFQGPARANAVLVQPSGRLLVAGESDRDCIDCSRLALAAFLGDGQPDYGFGHEGAVNPLVDAARGEGASETAYALANQPHGAILVGGLLHTGRDATRFFLRRFLSDGRPDPSFGVGGEVTRLPLVCRGTTVQLRAAGCLPRAQVTLRSRDLGSPQPVVDLTVQAPPWEGLHAIHLRLPRGMDADPSKVLAGAQVKFDSNPSGTSGTLRAGTRRVSVVPQREYHREIELRLSRGQIEAVGGKPPSQGYRFGVLVEFSGGSSELVKVKRRP